TRITASSPRDGRRSRFPRRTLRFTPPCAELAFCAPVGTGCRPGTGVGCRSRAATAGWDFGRRASCRFSRLITPQGQGFKGYFLLRRAAILFAVAPCSPFLYLRRRGGFFWGPRGCLR